MRYKKFNGVARKGDGSIASGATITVYEAGTSNVVGIDTNYKIYSDEGTTELSNPFTADSTGKFGFYVQPGDYDIQISGTGVSTYKLQDVSIDKPQVYDILEYGAVGDGTTDDYTAFNTANTALTNGGVLFLPANTYRIGTGIDFNSNIVLKFDEGAILKLDSGVTITINGGIDAGLYQVFSGDGQVKFFPGSTDGVYPQWWGAKAGNSTDVTQLYDSTEAFQKAFNSYNGSLNSVDNNQQLKVLVPAGFYKVTSVALSAHSAFIGDGMYKTHIMCASETGESCFYFDGGGSYHGLILIRGISFQGTPSSGDLLNLQWLTQSQLEDCSFSGAGTYNSVDGNGCYLYSLENTVIDDCTFGSNNSGHGLSARYLSSVSISNSLFTENGNKGLYLVSMNGAGLIINNSFFTSNGAEGIRITDVNEGNIIISDIASISNVENGINLYSNSAHINISNSIIANNGNGVNDTAVAGIVLSDSSASISDCIVTDYASKQYYGVYHSGTGIMRVSGGMISGNVSGDIINAEKVEGTYGSCNYEDITVFTDGDTTPSVKGHNNFATNNSASTSITTFDDGVVGQMIRVVFFDANTTLVNSADLVLSSGANESPAANSWKEFIYINNGGLKWTEVAPG